MRSAQTLGPRPRSLPLCLALFGLLSLGQPADAEPRFAPSYYFDSRGHNTLNLSYAENELPLGLELWGFTDLDSDGDLDRDRYDLSRYFSELRLTRAVGGVLGLQLEMNDAAGDENRVVRVGIVRGFRLRGHFLLARAFPYESDGDGGQLSLAWRSVPLFSRVTLEGFVDQNLSAENSPTWVSEAQIRFRAHSRVDLLVEFRVNEYLRRFDREDRGVAFGLSLKG